MTRLAVTEYMCPTICKRVYKYRNVIEHGFATINIPRSCTIYFEIQLFHIAVIYFSSCYVLFNKKRKEK